VPELCSQRAVNLSYSASGTLQRAVNLRYSASGTLQRAVNLRYSASGTLQRAVNLRYSASGTFSAAALFLYSFLFLFRSPLHGSHLISQLTICEQKYYEDPNNVIFSILFLRSLLYSRKLKVTL
jgi:hypothetical protein